MRYAYDLDGTLAFTKEAVFAAYKAVGVTPPHDFFYKPWREWLVSVYGEQEASDLHAEKNIIYLEVAKKLVKPTPILDLYNARPGVILTGASEHAARAVLATIGVEKFEASFECTLADKANWLNTWKTIGDFDGGIYFDDDLSACKYLRKETGWTTIYVRF